MQRWRDYLGEKKGKRNSLLFYCQPHLLSQDGNIHALFNKLLWSKKFANKSRQQKAEGEKACFGTIAAEGGTSTYQTRILFIYSNKRIDGCQDPNVQEMISFHKSFFAIYGFIASSFAPPHQTLHSYSMRKKGQDPSLYTQFAKKMLLYDPKWHIPKSSSKFIEAAAAMRKVGLL